MTIPLGIFCFLQLSELTILAVNLKKSFLPWFTVQELYIFAGLAKSKSEVRRLIKGGGARINDVKVVVSQTFV